MGRGRGALLPAVVVIGAMTSVVGVGAAADAATPPPTSPWAQTNASAADSRDNPAAHVPNASDAGKIKFLRDVTAPPGTPGGICVAGAEQPVLVGDYLYDISTDGVSAYDARTGALRWHSVIDTSGVEVYSGLAVQDGIVVVGHDDSCETNDPNGVVSAFDATTGQPVWSYDVEGPINSTVVSGSTVLVEGENSEDGGQAVAIDLSSGTLLWSAIGPGCPENAVVVDGFALYDDCNALPELVAADLATGAVVWTKPGAWSVERGDTDATGAHDLYATSPTGVVVDLDPSTGATRYSLSGATRTLAVDGARVYAACPQSLCAYSRANGALVWTRDVWGSGQAQAVAVAGKVLYANNGVVLDASSGKLLALLGDPDGTDVSVGAGRVAIAADERIIDLYGLRGE